MSWMDALIYLGCVAAVTVIAYSILMFVLRIKEHKRYMKYTAVEQKEKRLREIAQTIRAKGKYYVITEKDVEDW